MLLLVQHGMTDTPRTLTALARLLSPEAAIIAPSLGYWRTVWRYQPLLDTVTEAATAALTAHPEMPVRILATSLGGVLWLDVLAAHPEWWPRIERLILLGSPVRGAELARLLPTDVGRSLCRDRELIAAQIATQIPTLSLASRTLLGGDGTVSVASTQFRHCQWHCFEGVWHSQLRWHPRVVRYLQSYWSR